MEVKEEQEQELIGEGVNFERIRRITGYLTGTVNTWNNAKQAELHDRVKHTEGDDTDVYSEYQERNSTEGIQHSR